MACCIVTLNDVVSLKLLKSKHIYNFYRIKKEEEENHRNKKEITTKFDEEPHFPQKVSLVHFDESLLPAKEPL